MDNRNSKEIASNAIKTLLYLCIAQYRYFQDGGNAPGVAATSNAVIEPVYLALIAKAGDSEGNRGLEHMPWWWADDPISERLDTTLEQLVEAWRSPDFKYGRAEIHAAADTLQRLLIIACEKIVGLSA